MRKTDALRAGGMVSRQGQEWDTYTDGLVRPSRNIFEDLL